jgi:hypothetical protein
MGVLFFSSSWKTAPGRQRQKISKSLFQNTVLGSTGYQPVLSGDSPDGTEGDAARPNDCGLLRGRLNHSVRRVAERDGRVARTTFFRQARNQQLS